jgi:hypothetical protein
MPSRLATRPSSMNSASRSLPFRRRWHAAERPTVPVCWRNGAVPLSQLILKRAKVSRRRLRRARRWRCRRPRLPLTGRAVGSARDVDAYVRLLRRPLAGARLRAHARGCDGGIREELAARELMQTSQTIFRVPSQLCCTEQSARNHKRC